MKVSSITRQSISQPNIKFGSTARIVYKHPTRGTYSTHSNFLRPDLEWIKVIELIKNKYTGIENVKILNYACSDGSEPFTLAMLIKEQLGQDYKKFFPIEASDFDPDNIKQATSGSIVLFNEDFFRLRCDIPNWQKYLKKDSNYKNLFHPQDSIKDNVIFEVKNILDVCKSKLTNTIIFTRNMWGYLNETEQNILAKRLATNLDNTCLLIIGALERTLQQDKLLERNGFIKTSVNYVYTLAKKVI